jgi:hypothetical protein
MSALNRPEAEKSGKALVALPFDQGYTVFHLSTSGALRA